MSEEPPTPDPSAPERNIEEEDSSTPSKWAWLVPSIMTAYALCLACIAVDQIFELGWLPSRLESQIRSHISHLAAESQDARQKAKAALEQSPRFVAIPELMRSLNSDSAKIRSESASLLTAWTKDYLNGDLMGYSSESPPPERKLAIRKLWKWWQVVRQDF